MNIQQTLREISKNQTKISSVNQCLFVFGNTGVGKSTTVHFLEENQQLKAQVHQDDDQSYFTVQNNNDNLFSQVIISKEVQSETSVPSTVKGKHFTYRDFPGFQDNKGKKTQFANQDLKNSFYMLKGINTAQSYKLILVVSYNDIKQVRSTNLSNFLNSLTQYFSNLQNVKQNCTLLITNCKQKTSRQFISKKIYAYIEHLKEKQDIDRVKFLQHLVKNEQIIIFRQPKNNGKVDFIQSKVMRESIKNLQWKQNTHQLKLCISPYTKNLLQQNKQKICDRFYEINKQYCENISSELKKLYDQKKFTILNVQMIRIRNEFLKFKNKLFYLIDKKEKDQKIKTIHPISDVIQSIFKPYPSLIQKLTRFTQVLQFLDQIKKVTETQFYQLQIIIDNIISMVKVNLDEQTQIVLIDGNQIAIKTITQSITAQQIQLVINSHKNNFDSFAFLCNQILLHSNIVAKSKNIIFITNSIQTSQIFEIIIDLCGVNGENEFHEHAIDQHGFPGASGSNSGSLYISTDFITGNGLKAYLKGGNGVLGQSCQVSSLKKYVSQFDQQGNYLKKDVCNKEQDKLFLKERVPHGLKDKQGWSKFTHAIKSMTTFNGQVLETYSTVNLKAWSKFYQFVPGKGGNAGKPGIFKLIYKSKQLSDHQIVQKHIKVQNSESQKGENGQVSIQNQQGVYLRELVMCAVRQQGKSYSQQTNMHIVQQVMLLGTIAVTGQIVATHAIKQTVQKTGFQLFKQTFKQLFTQTAITTPSYSYSTGLIGFGTSLGAGILVQSILSPIVASLTDKWIVQPQLKGRKLLQVPIHMKVKDTKQYFQSFQMSVQSFVKLQQQLKTHFDF